MTDRGEGGRRPVAVTFDDALEDFLEKMRREREKSGEEFDPEKVRELYRIGDCVAPRKVDMAIWEGHKVGREI